MSEGEESAEHILRKTNGAAERRTRPTNDAHKFHRPCATSSLTQPPLHYNRLVHIVFTRGPRGAACGGQSTGRAVQLPVPVRAGQLAQARERLAQRPAQRAREPRGHRVLGVLGGLGGLCGSGGPLLPVSLRP